MDTFNKITIANFIWYLVPGIALIFYIFFPLMGFFPNASIHFIDAIGPIGLIILGSILGFFLDGLRLYRFRSGYSKMKKDFFEKIRRIIPVNDDPYIIQSLIYDVARSKNHSGLSLHHAIWIMLGHFAILTLLESFFWLILALYFTYLNHSIHSLFGLNLGHINLIIICVFFGLSFFLMGFRLLYISNEDQKTTNNMFSSFAEQHRDEIINLYKD